jgi:hypothetical protein
MRTFKIQQLTAAPEPLVKNHEILGNKQMRFASNEETDGDFGNGIISKLDSKIRRGFEARSRSANENVRTMEERVR